MTRQFPGAGRCPDEMAPAHGLAIALVGGTLFWAGVVVSLCWWWGRP